MALITINTSEITDADRAVLKAIGFVDGTAVVETINEDKPKRTRRTKAEMEAARAAETEAEQTGPEDEIPTPDSENAESDAVTLDKLKALATELLAKHGRSAVQEIVDALGLKRLSDATEDQYPTAARMIEDKLNG